MTRLLVIGPCPAWALPAERIASAKNVRAWQLLAPLLADGHEVLLAISDIGDASPQLAGAPANLRCVALPPAGLRWPGRLRRLCAEFQPQAALAIMWQNAVLATRLPGDLPLWADLFGYALGEAQVALARADDLRPPLSAIAFNRRVLGRGDVFSACGERHAHALVGELGMAGRLNARTTGYEFVHAIPPGIAAPPPPVAGAAQPVMLSGSTTQGQLQQATSEASRSSARPFVGDSVQPELALGPAQGDSERTAEAGQPGVRLLWIGGYNAWTDVDTLFAGVQAALAACPALTFISTGGAIANVDRASYPRLLAHIAASPQRERFRMLGWVSAAELEAELAAADIGIAVDASHYETRYGTRTRLADMLARGIPVVVTRGCELSDLIAAEGAGLAPPPGDAPVLAGAILALAGDAAARRAAAANARRLSAGALDPWRTTQPLRAWAAAPSRAPDRLSGSHPPALSGLRAWARLALWDIFARPV